MKWFLGGALLGFLARLMPALPSVGTDTNVWGTELNAFLSVAHDATTGALLDSALGKLNFNIQNGNYTLQNSDSGKLVSINAAAASTLTIPSDASMTGGAMADGSTVMLRQGAGGGVTVAAGSGVTLNSRGGLVHVAGQYGYAMLLKTGANVWELSGDIS